MERRRADPFLACKVGPLACMCLYEDAAFGHDAHDLVYDPLAWANPEALPGTSPRPDLTPSSAGHRESDVTVEKDSEDSGEEQEADDGQEELSPDHMLPRELIAQTDKLEWAQVVLKKMWPHLNRATEKIVKNKVEPKLQDKLPQAMKQLHFTKVDLADTLQFEVAQSSEPPISKSRCNIMKIGPIRIWLAPCQHRERHRRGVEIHIGIDLRCSVDIELKLIGKLRASIQELEIQGNLVIRLEPLIEESPIVGGLVIYFLDPPRIHVKWGGLSSLANYPGLSGAVRRVIDQLVADALVLPNLLLVPIVSDGHIVDNAMLKDPKALGVMRVTLRRATIRGTEWQLRTEPYFRMQLSAEAWESSVKCGTKAVAWDTDEYHDFLVYDREQLLCIHMYDNGRTRLVGHPHDRIGRAEPVMVGHLLRKGKGGKRRFQLFASKRSIGSTEPPCGEVTVQLDWFQITPSFQQEHQCVVKVKVDSAYIPADCGVESAALCVRIGGQEKTTPTVRRTLLKQGLVHQYHVDYVIRLPTKRELVDNSSLVLEIVDGKRRVIGTHELDLTEVSKSVNCIKVWGVAGSPAARMTFGHKSAKRDTTSAEVTVVIQGMSRVEHELACKEMKRDFHPRVPDSSLRGSTGELETPGPLTPFLGRAPTLAFGKRSSLVWLNKLFEKLWPKLVSYIERKMVDQYGSVTQKLRKGVPAPLKSICFSKFNLGGCSPELGPIKVNDTPEQPEWQGLGGMEIRVHVRLDPPADQTADIEITVMGMKVGICALRLKGELVVRLEPFLNEMPVVGGIVVCFLDPPKLKMDFSGLGRVADSIFLAERVRGVINSEISRFLVMPNVIGVGIATEDQGVDPALLRNPRPLGVLQVTAVRAKGIAPDCWRMLRKPLCNPYLRLALADDEFITSVCSRTCDPEWPETNTYDFMVFDWRQKLEVTVCEGYTLRSGQHELGHARPLYVMDAVEKSQNEEFIPLYAPKSNAFDDDDEDEEPRCGEVLLRCQWLHLVSGSMGTGTSDMCNIRVKIDQVWTNFNLADSFMTVRARVGTMDWKQTRRVRYVPPPKFAGGANPEGLPSQKPASPGLGDQVELDIQYIFNLMTRTEDINLGTHLELELVDRRERPFGSYSIQLKEVSATPQLRRCWGGKSGAVAKLKMFGPNSEESDVDLDVTIQGLTSTD